MAPQARPGAGSTAPASPDWPLLVRHVRRLLRAGATAEPDPAVPGWVRLEKPDGREVWTRAAVYEAAAGPDPIPPHPPAKAAPGGPPQ